MSYTPTEWVTGDIVTAEKLNKLENAVANGVVPEYTSADKGKVLTLGDGSGSEMVVAVPEQTVTITGGQPEPLSDADESVFVVGRTGVLTYNGTDYNVVCEDAEGTLVFGSDDSPVGILLLHAGVCLGGMAQTATVSLTVSVPSVEPKWEAVGGFPTLQAVDNDGTITLQSSYNEVVAAYAKGTAILKVKTDDGSNDVLLSPIGKYVEQAGVTVPMYLGSLIGPFENSSTSVILTQYKIFIDESTSTADLTVTAKTFALQGGIG